MLMAALINPEEFSIVKILNNNERSGQCNLGVMGDEQLYQVVPMEFHNNQYQPLANQSDAESG